MKPHLSPLLLLAFFQNAYAATLVDNFPIVTQTNDIQGGGRGAQPFRTGQNTFVITDVALAATSQVPSQQVAVVIYDNAFSFKPNNPVATLFSGTAGMAGFTDNSLWVQLMIAAPVVFSSLSIQLEPDTIYWLVVENHSSANIYLGYTALQGSAPAQGEGYISTSKVGFGLTDSSFLSNDLEYSARIQAVPEPSSELLVLLITGFFLGLRLVRRRMNAA